MNHKGGSKLGVLIPGMGSVASTFICGVIACNKGLSKPIGSMTQMGSIRLGKRTENRNPLVKDFVPTVKMEDLVFTGWDINNENVYDIAVRSKVLEKELLENLRPELQKINVLKGVFDKEYVRRLSGDWIKSGENKLDLAEQVMSDIQNFNKQSKVDSNVMIWCGSTEVYMEPSEIHLSLSAFEDGLKSNHRDIAPSMIYAYAALKMGIPFANGAPNLTVDIPALQELAKETNTPIAGKDFKTGQTLMKTILAPGLKARQLGINGWFSTNILGNRDGEVLDDPDAFKTKEESKLGVLDTILEPDKNPELYEDLYHKVRINYYPPRGDDKEGYKRNQDKDTVDFRFTKT